jgi:hypothetical protein
MSLKSQWARDRHEIDAICTCNADDGGRFAVATMLTKGNQAMRHATVFIGIAFIMIKIALSAEFTNYRTHKDGLSAFKFHQWTRKKVPLNIAGGLGPMIN